MQIRTILRILGILLMIFSISMLTPLLVNEAYHEQFQLPFVIAFFCTLSTGFFLWLSCRSHKQELKTRDGFLIVVLFWSVLCSFAALPFIFVLNHHHDRITDAFFESVSGFTTTGASVIDNLSALPHALLFYRQQLQLLGGMGIVVLAVAILPMLGVGGMQLYRAETPGPLKDSKLTPRITQTAKALWYTYMILIVACMFSYRLAGMAWFDAIGESFATVSTGGFSMHDSSFAYYQSEWIEALACFFMLLGGTNFALHFLAFQKKSVKHYWRDEEFRFYILFLLLSASIISISLVAYGFFTVSHHTFITVLFNVISIATTTGFLAQPFSNWPTFTPLLLILLAIIGGCAASTSGGIKVIRGLLIFKQGKREMTRLIHPQVITNIKIGQQTMPEHLLQSMWSFISVYIALFLVLVLVLVALGNDFLSAFSATIAALSNSGLALGQMSANFATMGFGDKWVFIFAMIAGRLEIFSLLVLFSPHFWQK